METPKSVYLRPVLEVRLVTELLTVPKKVMVYWICMVFLLLPGQSGTLRLALAIVLQGAFSQGVPPLDHKHTA
jgi:hypothetical protein